MQQLQTPAKRRPQQPPRDPPEMRTLHFQVPEQKQTVNAYPCYRCKRRVHAYLSRRVGTCVECGERLF